jgi:hypothetical protein
LGFRLQRSFFVQEEGNQSDIDDEIFYLIKNGGFTGDYIESLEIERRHYFVQKLSDDIKRENDANKKAASKRTGK